MDTFMTSFVIPVTGILSIVFILCVIYFGSGYLWRRVWPKVSEKIQKGIALFSKEEKEVKSLYRRDDNRGRELQISHAEPVAQYDPQKKDSSSMEYDSAYPVHMSRFSTTCGYMNFNDECSRQRFPYPYDRVQPYYSKPKKSVRTKKDTKE